MHATLQQLINNFINENQLTKLKNESTSIYSNCRIEHGLEPIPKSR